MDLETSVRHDTIDVEPLRFTGERFVPTETGELQYEHLHRYALCAELVRGRVVLDIASGEGYGAALLARTASQVIGVDLSKSAVAHAVAAYSNLRNVRFDVGSCAAIPLADRSVDVVVSFETLEHVAEHDAMLAEIRRVLRPDGVLVISTPDRDVYTHQLGNRNEFHVRELSRFEFESLLSRSFSCVQLHAQRLATGSLVYPLGQPAERSPLIGYSGAPGRVVQGVPRLANPVYLLAVCGDRRETMPILPASLYLDASEDLFAKHLATAKWASDAGTQLTDAQSSWKRLHDEQVKTATWAQALERELNDARVAYAGLQRDHGDLGLWGQTLDRQLGDLRNMHEALQREHAALEERGHALNDELRRSRTTFAALDQTHRKLSTRYDEVRSSLGTIHESTSWRMTARLRAAVKTALTPPKSAKAVEGTHWLVLRKLFRDLPIAHSTKNKLRMWLFDHFHAYLTHLPFHAIWADHRDSMRAGFMRPAVVSAPATLTPVEQRAEAERLSLSTSDDPLVSVIIPVYGKLEYTLQCLRSIATHSSQVAYEVIVVDDNSPDETAKIVGYVHGVRLISNPDNLGFIRSCNRGASQARGEFLCFLNNDTEVSDRWLDELHATFAAFPSVGLAGSKLVYPDGKLQEAGGIIWKDGSAWNYGRGQDPTHPSYNYARQVDYCSGASIMVAASLFAELAGFDEHYLPAYGEDSDLALKIKQRGLRVMYQPLSMVVHHEGVTSGTDISTGIKSHQAENARKLYERWKLVLNRHQAAGVDIDPAKDRAAKYRVLVLDHCTPTPDQDAGSITALNLMLLLRQAGFQVTFIPEDNFLYMSDYTSELQRRGIEAIYAPHVTSVAQHVEEQGQRYDLVLIFRPTTADRHLNRIRQYCPNAKVMFHASDLHFLRMSREAELLRVDSLMAAADKMCEVELRTMAGADAVVVHSTAEREILWASLPDASIHVFPWAIPIRGTDSRFDDRNDIAFVGGYQHAPNVDAVKYFVSDIFPLIREKIPGVRFFVIGSRPPQELLDLAGPQIVVTGYVDDLGSLLDKMKVAVAPLRYGAGIKGKIGTTLSAGLPCIATEIAAEGMELTHGREALIADGPESFAAAILQAYRDRTLWDALSENGIEFARRTYGPEAAKDHLSDILRQLDFDFEFEGPANIYGPTGHSGYRVVGNHHADLKPLAVVHSAEEYRTYLASSAQSLMSAFEARQIALHSRSESYSIEGKCLACMAKSSFVVDKQCGAVVENGTWIPNWRERLECARCHLNNRQRLIATLMGDFSPPYGPVSHIYLMEQVTPIFLWAQRKFGSDRIIGSEYMGPDYRSGQIVDGYRHEDIEATSFASNSMDLVVSNDVFEHIPEPGKGLAEIARILRPGGHLLFTIPFYSDMSPNRVRAKLVNGKIEHVMAPQYHGNPISEKGSLVFTDFGWEVLGLAKRAGFSESRIEVYGSVLYGHMGGGQLVFRAIK